jgi:hypothetical protein
LEVPTKYDGIPDAVKMAADTSETGTGGGTFVKVEVAESIEPSSVWAVTVYSPAGALGSTVKLPVNVPAAIVHVCKVKRPAGLDVSRQAVP